MNLAGVDLAWQGDKNPTAIAIGKINNSELRVTNISNPLYGLPSILEFINSKDSIDGFAIDAPLIINNSIGMRDCERVLSKDYGSRYAGCHSSNLKLYPNATSVNLSKKLLNQGYQHLGTSKFQIECYPHPSIIEIFNLPIRLKYKKGKKSEKQSGQIELAKLIHNLQFSKILKLFIPTEYQYILSDKHIRNLRGKFLKFNEDRLDSIICLYIAGLYSVGINSITYGDTNNGYIFIPIIQCN